MLNTDMPKVLVISSTPFSKTLNNGKTLASFFYGYEKDKIAQLCFSLTEVDWDICDNYYVFSFNDVLKKGNGRKLAHDNFHIVNNQNGTIKKKLAYKIFHKFSQNNLPITQTIKNYLWKKIDLSKAFQWIGEFNPDVVFFQGFGLSFGYEIAMTICEKFEIPMILELTDDYTMNLHKFSIFGKINNRRYLSLFQKALEISSATILISDKMQEEYTRRFHCKNTAVLMNSVEINKDEKVRNRDKNDYVYAGNVLINRWKVLVGFAKALKKVDGQAKLHIYTPDIPNRKILKAFQKQSAINYGGRLNKEQLQKRLAECGHVVFVESFNKKYQRITRLSLSTKVSEYMASGALIVAIGPPNVGSMEYLRKNDIAHCIVENNQEIMERELRVLLQQNDMEHKRIEKAKQLCEERHCLKKTREIINRLLLDVT